MHDLDLAGHVLVHGEGVDDAHRVALPQALELGDDLAMELGMLEPEHDELYWSNGHGSPFGRVITACDVVVEAVRGRAAKFRAASAKSGLRLDAGIRTPR